MKLVNLTAHEIVVYHAEPPTPDHAIARWPTAGPLARIEEHLRGAEALHTDQGPIPVVQTAYTSTVIDLPEPSPGTAYIVSRVLAAAIQRPDLYYPSGEVRDANGRIVGCRALGQFVSAKEHYDA